ncbi:MAG TPA: hypothetical protein VFE74_00640 [Ramlibacter sp.]|nr:hypothetical protein [Ramlibacter sp.]
MERQPSPRAQTLGVLLPLLALFLLMPPFVTLFTADGSVAGVPLIVVYLFGIWGLLLVATWLLARVLMPDPDGAEPTEDSILPPEPPAPPPAA